MPRKRSRAAVAAAAVLALLAASPSPARATDTLPWSGAAAKGANQPFQHGYTAADLLRWSPQSDLFGDLTRSRVPLQRRVAPIAATQANPNLDPAVENLTLAGDYGNAFFESYQYNNEFSAYLFNYWQYTDYYAAWHGMPTQGVPESMYDPSLDWREKWFEFGMLNLPNAAYTNAAHKNGVKSLGTVFLSENDRGTQTYTELLRQDANGDYPVARKLIELARWYGFDGYFINQEEPSVAPADIPRYKRFLKIIKDAGLYVQFYDSVHNSTGARVYQNEFNSTNSPFVRDPQLGDVSDSMFLNYWWSRSKLASSAAHAKSLGLDPRKAVFAGVEAGMYQFNQPYNLDDNAGANAIATLGADFVHADMAGKEADANQWKAYDRERRWWTGSSTGGAQDAGTWKGIKSYITERSAISGPVFDTTFNTGHGLEYVDRGALSSTREWSNINVQDHPVTWQWNHTGSLGIDYDYGAKATRPDRFGYQQIGGYQGGSSLVLSGNLTGDDYLKLYRTDLDVTAQSTLSVTYRKVSATDSSQLSAAVTFADAPTTVVRLPITGSGTQTGGWTTATVGLGPHSGRRIATIGLVVAGSGISGYQLNVGRITVQDGRDHTPAKPAGFHLRAGLIGSGELELGWDLGSYDRVAEYAVYDGTEYLGGIYDDVLYVKRFSAPKGTLKLVAIGHDGSVSEPAELPYDFTRGPGNVTATAAADGTVTVKWANPAQDFTVQGRRVPDGATQAVLTGQPVGGGHYLVTVTPAGGTPVSYRGKYADTVIEPYPTALVRISGNRFTFGTPATADWYKLYVEENGVAKTFATTYSSGTRPYIIRGRTTTAALSVTMSSATSRVTVTIEDYAGNRATTVVRGTVSSLS